VNRPAHAGGTCRGNPPSALPTGENLCSVGTARREIGTRWHALRCIVDSFLYLETETKRLECRGQHNRVAGVPARAKNLFLQADAVIEALPLLSPILGLQPDAIIEALPLFTYSRLGYPQPWNGGSKVAAEYFCRARPVASVSATIPPPTFV
jgi:hypothetical protein